MSMQSFSSDGRQSKDAISARLVDCHRRALYLMTVEHNYDYAHTLLAECVIRDPANAQYVESLFRNLNASISRKKRMPWLFGSGNRSLYRAIDKKLGAHVFRIGIEHLKNDPQNVQVLWALADACSRQHYNEAELVYLKQTLDSRPKDADVNRRCALALARMGQFDQAIACWHRVEILRPGDHEATQMILQLNDEKLKYPGGRPPHKQKQPEIPSIQKTRMASDAQPTELPVSLRQRLEEAIAANPHAISNYLELAEYFAESRRFQAAEETIARGKAICGTHPELHEWSQKIKLMRSNFESELLEAKRRVKAARQKNPFQMPWLELGLSSAILILALQLSPKMAATTWKVVDFRQWSRLTWFIANLAFLGVLTCIKFRHQINLWPWRKRFKRA